MPEGDTIYQTARRLREVLEGRTIDRARARDAFARVTREEPVDAESLVGRTIDAVEPRGKHLLLRLDDGRTVHSHLGMSGSWHVYDPGEAWQKPERQAALALDVGDSVAVCFSPKILELLTETRLRRHPWISRLGPDILVDPFDADEAVRRFRANGQSPIGEAVLNQTIVCGIGNVYKSEVLFILRVDPFAAVKTIDDDRLRAILRESRSLMRRNLEGYPRRTRFGRDGASKWVYRRGGERCLKCDEFVRMRRQGDLGRSTYWCPSCQSAG